MTITPLVLAIRAVSADFAQRIFLPLAGIVGGALVLLLGVLVWLVTLSDLWWLLLAPLIIIGVFIISAIVLAGSAIRFLRPRQTKEQQLHVRRFVDALQYAAETASTPKFFLLFRLVLDLLMPSKKGIVSELSEHATSLQKDLRAIISLFS